MPKILMIIDKIHNCDKGWWGLRKFVKIVFPVFRKVELSWTEILLKYWRSFVNKVVLSYIFCFWSVGAWIKVENRLFQPQIKLRLSMTVGNLGKTIYFSLVVLKELGLMLRPNIVYSLRVWKTCWKHKNLIQPWQSD